MTAVSQDMFRAALLDAVQPVPEGLRDGTDRPAGRRYAVYRNNVAVSLREALETGFPAVARLLGPENFAYAAGRYLREEQPASPLMAQYGAGFPDFLARQDALARWGYLPDVARLELALRRSYHAADREPVVPAALAALSQTALDGARLRMAPAVQVLRSDWPVLSVWRYSMRPGSPKPPAQAEDVVILRPGFDPEPHLLPQGGAAFLKALATDMPFAAAIEAAGADFDLSSMLMLLLQGGALTDLVPGE